MKFTNVDRNVHFVRLQSYVFILFFYFNLFIFYYFLFYFCFVFVLFCLFFLSLRYDQNRTRVLVKRYK